MPKTVALFVDVQTLHHQLHTQHHRSLDAAQLLESARKHGEVNAAVAIGDWNHLPADYREAFEEQDIEVVDVERRPRSRESGGRRREVLRDLIDLELLAQMVEHLFNDDGAEVDGLVVATGDDLACRAITLVRQRFGKDVSVIGVEGAVSDALQEAATTCETLPLPPLEPADLEGLEKLVPLLEDLERRKRYLNFKYIRETVVRRLDLPERSFEAAERLLSDAIACGLLLKKKIEDKYNPGQLFTAYALDRDNELFDRFGSGEPAPVHTDPPEKKEPPPATPKPAQEEAEEQPPSRSSEQPPKKRKRRRRRRGSNTTPTTSAPAQLSAGGGSNNRRRKRGRKNHQHNQDRVGRVYEAPSRFLSEELEDDRPMVDDDDIDEDRILAARGDL